MSSPAKKGDVLYRPYGEVCEQIRDFVVAVNRRGRVVGTASLHVWWDDIGEIRSLVVDPRYRRRGIASSIVLFLLDEAKALGMRRVFALTRVGDLFEKLGFGISERNMLPQKVWVECVRCPKFMNCDEEAYIIDL